MNNQTENQIKKVMSMVLEIDESQINDNTSPDSVAGWDSLKQMTLILSLEEEFGIRFEDDQIPELLSYNAFKVALADAGK
jgi:acyl carrier protein